MPLNFEYDETANRVLCRPSGVVTVFEIADYFLELAADERIQPHFVEVLYMENVTDFRFSAVDFQLVAKAFAQLLDLKSVRAIVCLGKTPLHFGIGRMMQSIFAIEHPDFETHVVRTEEDAERILADIQG